MEQEQTGDSTPVLESTFPPSPHAHQAPMEGISPAAGGRTLPTPHAGHAPLGLKFMPSQAPRLWPSELCRCSQTNTFSISSRMDRTVPPTGHREIHVRAGASPRGSRGPSPPLWQPEQRMAWSPCILVHSREGCIRIPSHRVWLRDVRGTCVCAYGKSAVWMETAFTGAEWPREGSPPETASGLWPAPPTLLAALQRLLVAQLQLHVERVAVLPEGNPRTFGQVLGTAAMVVYSSGRMGPCGGAELRRWPQILLGVAYALPTPPPRQGHSPP